jgi:hypothetical protein
MRGTLARRLAADHQGVPPIRTSVGIAIILIGALLAFTLATTRSSPHTGHVRPPATTVEDGR